MITTAQNFLSEIIACKRKRLAEAKRLRPLEELRAQALRVRRDRQPHAFLAALEARDTLVKIIAEYKRASPSKGVIRADLSPVDVARAYKTGGAAAMSVLTEEDYFQGSLDDLKSVSDAVTLPLLRKDFIFDEYQIYEAASAGASAVLLISAVLDDKTLSDLHQLTEETLGMDALLEVHTEGEMARAASSGAKIIGVNNRDLQTFAVSLETSIRLARHAPAQALLVSESGLGRREDIVKLQSHGYRAFLIGETLMRSRHPSETLRELISPAR